MGRQIEPPRIEGTVTLTDGRRIGFAEYGIPDGRPVLWFHGTPGARRQVPPATRKAAIDRGIRVIALERPGIGASTPHLHDSVLAATADVEEVVDRLGIDRFALVGLSGGGPYVLASAHRLPERVVSAAVMGCVAPTRGEDAVPGGAVDLTRRFAPQLHAFRDPLGLFLWGVVRAVGPVSSQVFDLYVRISPEGDKRVLGVPGMKDMFIDDLIRGSRRHFAALVSDIVLFGQHWGFELADLEVPIHFWQGDADNIVPVDHASHLAGRVPGSELRIRVGDGHLGNLDASDEVFEAMDADWADTSARIDSAQI